MVKDLRKNTCEAHEKTVRQCSKPIFCEVGIISLKSSLLYCLTNFFENNREEELGSFIDFLYDRNSATGSERSSMKSLPVRWEKIPLQQKITSASVLYISALPQVIAHGRYSELNCPGASQLATQQLAEQLNNFQLITIDSLTHTQPLWVALILPFISCIWNEFEIGADRSGWLTFELSDKGLSYWLSHFQRFDQRAGQRSSQMPDQTTSQMPRALSRFFLRPLPNQALEKPSTGRSARGKSKVHEKIVIEEHLWRLQHTFARCNSYLRQSAVYIDSVDQTDSIDPADEANFANEARYLDELAAIASTISPAAAQSARDLVQEIVLTTDAMFWIPYQYPVKRYLFLLKRANLLCQSFQCFYGDCLPKYSWVTPSVDPDQKAVQQSQLTLVLAVRNVLETLLERYFQETAPRSL